MAPVKSATPTPTPVTGAENKKTKYGGCSPINGRSTHHQSSEQKKRDYSPLVAAVGPANNNNKDGLFVFRLRRPDDRTIQKAGRLLLGCSFTSDEGVRAATDALKKLGRSLDQPLRRRVHQGLDAAADVAYQVRRAAEGPHGPDQLQHLPSAVCSLGRCHDGRRGEQQQSLFSFCVFASPSSFSGGSQAARRKSAAIEALEKFRGKSYEISRKSLLTVSKKPILSRGVGEREEAATTHH